MKNVRQATEERRSCCQFTEKRRGLRRSPRLKTVHEQDVGTLHAALDPIEGAASAVQCECDARAPQRA
jgi:hypothetical protein